MKASKEKKQQIGETLKATRQRRRGQFYRCFELKISTSLLSKSKKEKLNKYFLDAKRVHNDFVKHLSKDENYIYNYKDHRTVKVKYPDKHYEKKEITLPTALHQDFIALKYQDLKSIEALKESDSQEAGELKYTSEVNCIPAKTGRFKISKKNKNKITFPGFRNIRVRGLDEIYKLEEYELANAFLIRKPSGFYIKLNVAIPKEGVYTEKEKEIGVDFGIKKAITTSDGNTYDPIIEETEHLKHLQKKLSGQIKGSNNYWKTVNAIRKEYEHLSNIKLDVANKLVAELTKESIVYFQDEQLSNWKKTKKSKKTGKKCGFSFGKKIHHSILGRVKARLIRIKDESKGQNAFMISKWQASTKICFKCGTKTKIGIDERTFKCPKCGYKEDRDVHAAMNIKKFGQLKKSEFECLEQTSVETKTSSLDKSLGLFKSKSCR